MSINFNETLPWLGSSVDALARTPIIQNVNETAWIFAVVETGHLLFLAILGGAVFGLNLRVLGLILPDMSAKDVERMVRPYYRVGVAGSLLTGLAMGLTVARTLLPSGAFFIKILALLAAIALSHVLTQQVRNGRTRISEQGLLAFATLFWLGSLFLFASTEGLDSGALLVGLAGAGLLAAAVQRRLRPVVMGFSTAALALWFVALDGSIWPGPTQLAGWFDHAALAVVVVPALGAGIRGLQTDASSKLLALKLLAFASTLTWVTVAAAGRWIGFS
ncbi:DUF6644 family protein [Sphingobium cupriresistens]|uniref:DUF6644 domain-containing protein n=1 Tax=Sphingobium cupriresistens TaxID=1132417 RepID=A0A8G2DU10_9SPHN|nr:DUF6644 family protein [Sphingobium cupriresistens]RYM06472.1 hypothetical protein EWH12_20120 [Sphingobium cupriresistens]